jgi:ATP adenylyltransferase/5',5'''-P-1,P-4-tetraphosphate phosphorylase II
MTENLQSGETAAAVRGEDDTVDGATMGRATRDFLAQSPTPVGRLPKKPARMHIIGEERPLVSLVELFAGIWEISSRNCVDYRERWKQFLPRLERDVSGKMKYDTKGQIKIINSEWSVAYDPIVAVRRCYSTRSKPAAASDWPYFIVILNTARDERPRREPKMDAGKEMGKTKEKDPLQEHLIDRDLIIAQFGDFFLCPNGYPYHRYASLLIAQDPQRQQDCPTPHEIETWMRFSILTKQFVFFNSPGAGASIPTRMHAQVVDPAGIRCEDREVIYPLLNEKIVRRRPVREGIEVLSGYGVEALVFSGLDAPHRASLAIKKLRDEQGHSYNIMIKEKEVFVVPRNAQNETSHCIGKRVGAYEMSGVILVGNIEEPLLERLDLDRVVNGAEIFAQLSYEQISSNIRHATANLGGLERRL